MIMEKNERIIAITRILPGLEAFLREVLANENLSTEAEKQRLDFVKELEQLTKPPTLPPRPTNLKTQSRASVDSIDSVENDDNDFASVQRKLSNIFYMRRDFDELNEHFVNGFAADEASKGTTRKVPAKSGKRTKIGKGIYEPLPGTSPEPEADLDAGVLSEEETSRIHNRSLARGTHIRQSLSRGKWFAKKEKSTLQEVYVSDLQLPTISGHLMEVRTNKRRWCVLKDQHLYIFKTQEEPALFQIALPGCDISTVPKNDKTKVSYSFKITQDGVAAVILGIEEEKDLSAWMNALITASVAKNYVSPQAKASRTLPRSMHAPWNEEEPTDEGTQSRRHTVGSSSKITNKSYIEIDFGTYEKPTDIVCLDTDNYNPPLPLLPGEISNMLEKNGDHAHVRPLSKCSGIYEEVGDEFIHKYSMKPHDKLPADVIADNSHENANDGEVTNGTSDVITNGRRGYSEVGTSDSEYSSDDEENKDENGNKRLFHDRWAVHSGVLYQKRQTGWNRRYCKIVDNCLRGFRNPNDLNPVLELNLSASNVRAAEAEGKRRFIFQLDTAESESLYFNTDTQESMERWIEVISVAATSRLEHSVTMSEDELDVGVGDGEPSIQETSEDPRGSRDNIPSPVPERKESLRKTRVNGDTLKSEEQKREEIESLRNGQYDKPEKLIAAKESETKVAATEIKGKDDQEIWRKRDPHPSYATTPRAKPGAKITKSKSVKESPKTTSTHSLDLSEGSLNSPQKTLQLSKKRQYSERLKKYLDQDGQFSGFILELRVKTNSTTLTRRWAVVQNGFLRIYENYGCAAPFLRISLVEAFLKDFSNVAKSRFCFMLEYGAGQSILFQTNTHQELKRWINVITLTIACHTDLFGSGWDLTQRERTGDVVDGTRSLSRPVKSKHSQVDGSDTTSSSDIFNSDKCECHHDAEDVTCTPVVVREAIYRKSYSLSSTGSNNSDDIVSRNANESFTYRSSLVHKVKQRGYLHVLYRESCDEDERESRENNVKESREGAVLQFCELKGSLFSIYESEKSENPKLVFNLLYDKHREVPNVAFTFTLTSDRTGTAEFGCETEQNYEAWKEAINNTALQDGSNSDLAANSCEKCASNSPIVRKRNSVRASFAEEEAKHREVLRSLTDDCTNCDQSQYSCYVYEVRDSSGNKTIIRRWCVVDGDLIRIFERETSRETVAELRPSAFRLKDIENPRGFPFAFKLERLLPQEGEDEFLVFQASNAKDFRELLQRIKSVQIEGKRLVPSKSETNINAPKKAPLVHSKSDLSLKRIFALTRKISKDNLAAESNPPGHDTWPKVVRRERKSSRRALSDTSTDRLVTNSLIENTNEKAGARNTMGCFLFDSEGKFSGYLIEVRNNALCRSEVRKWCVVQNDKFSVFDDKNSKSPNKVVELNEGAQLLDLSHVNPNSFEIRVASGVQNNVYRAADDFQKWLTVLAQAIGMCQKDEQGSGAGNSQVKSSKNGSVPGKNPEGKSAGEAKVKRKYGRKDIPSQTTPGTSQAEDTAF